MSQEKAQLIAPLGNMTVPGVTATGVITATSFEGNIAGSATSIKQGSSVSAGVVTASSFVGNLTGNIQRLADSGPNISVGVVTATSFSGNLTGSVTDLTSQPAITVGVVTATAFSGPVTGDIRGDITGNVSGVATGNVTGSVSGLAQGGLGINYNGGWSGAGTSQISAGVVTATSFYGDGSSLDGVSSGPVSQQAVTINGASTTIDLSSGNLIYASQSADTTVSFANSENGKVYFVRVKDATDTARTITWPDRIKWEDGTTPTLLNSNDTEEAQVFLLITRDMGVTWYGKEIYKNIGSGYDIFSWGGDNYGAGGTNSTGETSSPVQVGSSGAGWKTVYQSSDGSHTNFFGKLDNTLWSAGYNSNGNLAQNYTSPNRLSSPVQIPGNWSTDIVFSRHTMAAIKTDGTLWSWSSNGNGGLGQNQSDSQVEALSSPTQIGTDTTWSKVTAGGHAMHTIKTDGTLWSWGTNEYGESGLNNTTKYSSPVQVGTDTTWSKLSISTAESGSMSSAIKTDGTLWTWGKNFLSGQLGHNDKTGYSSPKQVGTDTNWANVASGHKASMAVKTDGTLWVMGDNERGALGLNQGPGSSSVDLRSSPTQIPGTNWDLTNFRLVRNSEAMMAMKQDGTLWSWGHGGGYLGLNDNNSRSSPTQVTGTWNQLGGGNVISASKA